MAGRFFSGTRSGSGKGGAASQAMRERLKKGGTESASETYKKMLKQKLAEAKMKAASGEKSAFATFGKVGQAPVRSKKAQEMMKQMALQQQIKENKKAKKAVIVEAKRLMNGNIDKKGRVFDIAGNQVAQVNLKNGAISTIYGQHVGIYKEKSYMTKMALEEAINKNSPYLINQRKLIAQQAQGGMPQIGAGFAQTHTTDVFGNAAGGNVWGNANTDVWGNPSGGGLMGFFSGFFR